jgi:hypothetical protein
MTCGIVLRWNPDTDRYYAECPIHQRDPTECLRALEEERDGLRAALQELLWADTSTTGDPEAYHLRRGKAFTEARLMLEKKP